MKIFVTGATGNIGSHTVPLLIAQGHTVVGLCRSKESADALRKLGGEPLMGDLKDLHVLEEGARNADAVIHLAFIHDFANYAASGQVDIAAIETFHKALAGTGKIFIGTSGTLIAGPTNGKVADESAPAVFGPRAEAEKLAVGFAKDNIKSMVFRLPPFVYGHNISGFLAAYIEAAKREKVVYYIGEGAAHSNAAHVSDVAQAYVLALTKGQAGAVYNIVAEYNFTYKEMAESIGKLLNLELKSIPQGDLANKYFIMALAFAVESQFAGVRSEKDLGWKPSGKYPTILQDIFGSYKVRA